MFDRVLKTTYNGSGIFLLRENTGYFKSELFRPFCLIPPVLMMLVFCIHASAGIGVSCIGQPLVDDTEVVCLAPLGNCANYFLTVMFSSSANSKVLRKSRC
jgi:hypothetical protein